MSIYRQKLISFKQATSLFKQESKFYPEETDLFNSHANDVQDDSNKTVTIHNVNKIPVQLKPIKVLSLTWISPGFHPVFPNQFYTRICITPCAQIITVGIYTFVFSGYNISEAKMNLFGSLKDLINLHTLFAILCMLTILKQNKNLTLKFLCQVIFGGGLNYHL